VKEGVLDKTSIAEKVINKGWYKEEEEGTCGCIVRHPILVNPQ
jgi:hypothetical protein